MKKTSIIYIVILYLSIFECFFIKQSSAFIPKINEPNKEELESTAIQIGKTAIKLIEYGQNKEAIKILKLAVKLNPKEIDLWTTLAESQVRSNKNYQALLSLKKAIKINPNIASIYFKKAYIHIDLNDPQKAKVAIKKGLSINKNNDRGYFQLGNAEIMLKNYTAAQIAFKKSLEIKPDFWQSMNNEGLILYELNNFKEAASKFRSAFKISDDAEPMLALAIVLYSLDNKSQEALDLAKNALRSNPKYVSMEYQTKQLWGKKLKKSAQLLFKNKEMETVVKEAKEKSK